MATKVLGQLASGQQVVDRYNSHIHPEVLPLLPEALAKIHMGDKPFSLEVVEFDHVVGETTCVRTDPSDQIVYAKRVKRYGLTRFVKNRRPEPCKSVVVILVKATDGSDAYVLVTAFIGEKPQPEPWDLHAPAESRSFWLTHALLWGTEKVVPGTETTECPW